MYNRFSSQFIHNLIARLSIWNIHKGEHDMIRTGIAAFLSVFLLLFEGFIVIKLKGYTGIYFGDLQLLVSVLAMNFFFVFTILTHIKIWHQNKGAQETEVGMK